MRLALAATAALMLATATPASAQKVDISEMKCSEFVAADKETIGFILVWLLGHYHEDDDKMVLDIGKMQKAAESIGKHCAGSPNSLLADVAEKYMQE